MTMTSRNARTATSTTWRNWAGTAGASPERVHTPRDNSDIAETVARVAANGRRVRVLGSGHSFTPIAVSDSDAIDLGNFTGITAADTDTGLVKVRAGTSLRALNAELDQLGLAMTNLGDIDSQTIAGAVSTGTHGTGAGFQGLSAQVAALELVLADGSEVECSDEQHPELFAAARVGLGALGVITHVTLRCESSFALAASERPMPLRQVVEGFDDLADNNDHFEFYWFPYGKDALVKRNNRLPTGATTQPQSAAREFFDYELTENVAFGAVCRLGRAVPRLMRPLGRLSSNLLSPREYSD